MADEERLQKARTSLERVQLFDTATLPRESQLGQALNFRDSVEPANKIINLFRQYPIDFLSELPDTQLQQLTTASDSFSQILTRVHEFDATQADSYNARTQLIDNIKNQYQPYFDQLYQIISYGSSRQRDFGAIEREARASMQRAKDDADGLMKTLSDQQEDAKRILDEIRKVAAEQGVSQQASYFAEESKNHEAQANQWRKWTIWTAIGLGLYAILSAVVHKLPWLAPTTTYEAFQLGLSKVLIFLVIGYMLILFARNFLTHTHNAIVNKHRQNALLTFNSLVNAAGGEERRDVILTYAAACIFSPQETGYTKGSAGPSEMPMSIIQALPKLVSGGAPH